MRKVRQRPDSNNNEAPLVLSREIDQKLGCAPRISDLGRRGKFDVANAIYPMDMGHSPVIRVGKEVVCATRDWNP